MAEDHIEAAHSEIIRAPAIGYHSVRDVGWRARVTVHRADGHTQPLAVTYEKNTVRDTNHDSSEQAPNAHNDTRDAQPESD
jgi:hypothetical protein